MLKLLIPIVDSRGAAEAARHSAFLFAERCVSMIEVVEVCKPIGHAHAGAKSRSGSLSPDRALSPTPLHQVCAILDDAGVPYTSRHGAGPTARVIAACVEAADVDIVVVDARGPGFLRKWTMLARLRRVCSVPVMLLH